MQDYRANKLIEMETELHETIKIFRFGHSIE